MGGGGQNGFSTVQEWQAAMGRGFHTAMEMASALSLGFQTKSDVLRGFEDGEQLRVAETEGCKTLVEWDTLAKCRGFSSSKHRRQERLEFEGLLAQQDLCHLLSKAFEQLGVEARFQLLKLHEADVDSISDLQVAQKRLVKEWLSHAKLEASAGLLSRWTAGGAATCIEPGQEKVVASPSTSVQQGKGASGVTFLSSVFRMLYDQLVAVPETDIELLAHVDKFIKEYCRMKDIPESTAVEFLKTVRREQLEDGVDKKALKPQVVAEMLDDVPAFAQRLWTSESELKHGGRVCTEFCSMLNESIRKDDRILLQSAIPVIRAINSLNVNNRKVRTIPPEHWPEDGLCFRGGGGFRMSTELSLNWGGSTGFLAFWPHPSRKWLRKGLPRKPTDRQRGGCLQLFGLCR